MHRKPRLTSREIRILSALANSNSYAEVVKQFNISAANLYTTCAHIRKKSGIVQTRDRVECASYLAQLSRKEPQRVANALTPFSATTDDLTECQLDVLRLIGLGRSYGQIATLLGILSQSVQNLATRACQRAGITHSGWNRTKYIREWLAEHDRVGPLAPRNPMDDPAF